MIAGNYTVTARDSWTTVPGHHVNMTYNANNDPTEEFFFDGENLVFVRRYQRYFNNLYNRIKHGIFF